jgi:hypothetical protein
LQGLNTKLTAKIIEKYQALAQKKLTVGEFWKSSPKLGRFRGIPLDKSG